MYVKFIFRTLETSLMLHKEGKHNISEVSGPSLTEAQERFKRYERKLKDLLNPNDEVLKKLSNTQQTLSQKNNQNQNGFPNGGNLMTKNNN